MKKILVFIFAFCGFSNIYAFGGNYTDDQASLSPLEQSQIMLAKFNQDIPPAFPSWPREYFNVHSFLNFDITPKTMQKTLAGEEQDYFALSNVGLNVDGNFDQIIYPHIGVAYFKTNKGQGDRYNNTGLLLDDAFITLANYQKSPLFLQGGQFYLPFGTYNRYAIIPTLTQILSTVRSAAVQMGAVNWRGFTGSLYLAQGQLKDHEKNIQGQRNFGGAIHYQVGSSDEFHFMAGAEYIYNLLQVNALAESEAYSKYLNYIYSKPIAGTSYQVSIGYSYVTLFGQYITALKKSNDLIKQYQNPTSLADPIFGAKPSAWDAGFMIKFTPWDKPTQIDFTYSKSKDTAGLYIFNSTRMHVVPEKRYIAGASMYLTKHLMMRLQWGHDWLYKEGHGDTGRQGDDVTIRFNVEMP